ncbi:MAG: TIGR03790 family protein [Puniceicoccaceae bacterium]
MLRIDCSSLRVAPIGGRLLVGWARFAGGVLSGLFGLALLSSAPAFGNQELANRIVVVANSTVPGSVELAKTYMRVRKIPEKNLIAFEMPTEETIGGRNFIEKVYNPLAKKLFDDGWLEGSMGANEDEYRRLRYSVLGNNISYLVLCKGVPLRFAAPKEWNAQRAPNPYLTTANASVDGELAAMALADRPMGGFIANPIFGVANPTDFDTERVVRVFRLDGPDFDSARRLIFDAFAAEQHGPVGKAFVDLGGPHPQGDVWLELAGKQMEAGGFTVEWDRGPGLMEISDGLQLPALYAGWYSAHVGGAWADPEFRVAQGAIAVHIHSYSAQSVRDANSHWVGPMILKGVTATVGNVWEPLLEFVHRPHMLFGHLLAGRSWGEACYYSLPALSWQAVAIGDPLYRPFANRKRP